MRGNTLIVCDIYHTLWPWDGPFPCPAVGGLGVDCNESRPSGLPTIPCYLQTNLARVWLCISHVTLEKYHGVQRRWTGRTDQKVSFDISWTCLTIRLLQKRSHTRSRDLDPTWSFAKIRSLRQRHWACGSVVRLWIKAWMVDPAWCFLWRGARWNQQIAFRRIFQRLKKVTLVTSEWCFKQFTWPSYRLALAISSTWVYDRERSSSAPVLTSFPGATI